VKWRLIAIAGLICATVAVIALQVIHSRQVGYWFQVHTGIINEPGPYYGFWSGFGSDITEFGIFGAIAAGVYQLVKKYNCHAPGCWRVGNHPAAGGQFLLCYRHHPDYQGRKPTRELIERMHREHLERQAAIHGKLDQIQQQLAGKPDAAQPAGNHQTDPAAASLSVPGAITKSTLRLGLCAGRDRLGVPGRSRRGNAVGGIEQDLLECVRQVAAPHQGRRGGQRMILEADPDHIVAGRRLLRPDRAAPGSCDDAGA
jgi:hypothetical protein